jgi:hypothetical protein
VKPSCIYCIITDLESIEAYLNLLRLLAARRFPFSQHDYHGRTIAQIFCDDAEARGMSVDSLSTVFKILKPDFHALDNLGNSLLQRLSNWAVESRLNGQWERHQGLLALLDQYNRPVRLHVDLRTILSSMSCECKCRFHWVQSINHVTWIDVNGDTALTAVLKEWRSEDDELKLRDLTRRLVHAGAELHGRDRNGDTALAIATIRGFRPVVALLLSLGASYHARDYQGNGILQQAKAKLQQAKTKKNDKLYAMVLCCITLLTDFGAKDDPSERDERMAPPPISAMP